MKASAELLRDLLEEKLNDIRSQFEVLFDALTSDDRAYIFEQNLSLLKLVVDLRRVVANKNWPECFSNLLETCQIYDNSSQKGFEIWKIHHRRLALNRENVLSFRFSVDVVEPILDFDEIIRKAEENSKVNELFDRIISILVSISEPGQIDSFKACQDLDRVIEMMRRSSNSSLDVKIMSWSFVKSFVPNLFSAYIKESSIAGPALSAFEKTAEDLGISLVEAKRNIGEEVVDGVIDGIRSIQMADTITKDIYLLPSPQG